MDSFLSVVTGISKARSKGQLISLSCSDLATIDSGSDYGESDIRRLVRGSKVTPWPKFLSPNLLRPKSPGLTKSRSSSELANSAESVNTVDCQLAKIRETLALFREQDMEFRERMDSLSSSIDELASRTSMASLEVSADVNDNITGKDMGNISANRKSSSSEVLNCIPTIKITCHKRRQSDPAETARNLASSTVTASELHSISMCSTNHTEESSSLL